MFDKKPKNSYPVKLLLIIRSEGDTNSTDINEFPKYYLYYENDYEMSIPPAIGISFNIWKPIKIKDIIVRGNETICFLEEQVLPSEKFEELMEKYRFHLSVEGWKENKSGGIRP